MIQSATLEHIPQINVINRICLPENYDLTYWKIIIQYGLSWVEICDNRVVGYIAVDCKGYIVSFAVLPRHRGKKIGSGLLNHVTSTLPFTKFKLTVRRSNIQAQKLYTKCGFTQSHIDVNGYDNEDAIIMIYKKNLIIRL